MPAKRFDGDSCRFQNLHGSLPASQLARLILASVLHAWPRGVPLGMSRIRPEFLDPDF
jgi:hypothetical protein